MRSGPRAPCIQANGHGPSAWWRRSLIDTYDWLGLLRVAWLVWLASDRPRSLYWQAIFGGWHGASPHRSQPSKSRTAKRAKPTICVNQKTRTGTGIDIGIDIDNAGSLLQVFWNWSGKGPGPVPIGPGPERAKGPMGQGPHMRSSKLVTFQTGPGPLGPGHR